MAVYGNIITNKLIAMDYVVQEGNNICKIFESMSVLNENGVLLEEDANKVASKMIFNKISTFLKNLGNTILNFFKNLKVKIRNLLGPSKNVTIDNLDVIDVKGYIEKYNEVNGKNSMQDVIDSCVKVGLMSAEWEFSKEQMGKLNEESAVSLEEMKKLLEDIKNPEKVTIANKQASVILNELDAIDTRKTITMLTSTAKKCEQMADYSSTDWAQFLTANGQIFRNVSEYFTVSANVWKEIQKHILTVYKDVVNYIKNNKNGGAKPAEESK